jgi:hypothetical protein
LLFSGKRLAALVDGELKGVFLHYIVEVLPGDRMQDMVEWVEFAGVIDRLHAEFISKSPIPTAKAEKAVANWIKKSADIAKAVAKAAEIVDRAKDAQSEAAKDVVRHFGRTPVTIEGVTYHTTIAPSNGRVYLVRSKAEDQHDYKKDAL